MHRLKVLKQIKMGLIPVSFVAGGAVTVVTIAALGVTKEVFAAKPPPPPPPPPKDCDPNKPLVRAKDLPIYYKPDNKIIKQKECKEVSFPDDRLMSAVKWSRRNLWNARKGIDDIKSSALQVIATGKSHANSTLDQLRDDENAYQRYGVIGAGTFIGFLFGLRRGFFKKILYTSTGAAAAAAICFPDDAEKYVSDIRELLNEYSSITYHFSNAAIRDLTGVELKIPEVINSNLVETVKLWIGNSSDGNNVSKSSPSSATLLPPVSETPSHVVPVSQPSKPGSIPMPPLDKPKSEFIEDNQVRDQSNPADRDMYSLRS